jgi:hypothetical protein
MSVVHESDSDGRKLTSALSITTMFDSTLQETVKFMRAKITYEGPVVSYITYDGPKPPS